MKFSESALLPWAAKSGDNDGNVAPIRLKAARSGTSPLSPGGPSDAPQIPCRPWRNPWRAGPRASRRRDICRAPKPPNGGAWSKSLPPHWFPGASFVLLEVYVHAVVSMRHLRTLDGRDRRGVASPRDRGPTVPVGSRHGREARKATAPRPSSRPNEIAHGLEPPEAVGPMRRRRRSGRAVSFAAGTCRRRPIPRTSRPPPNCREAAIHGADRAER